MTKAVLYIRSTLVSPPAKQRPRIQKYVDMHNFTVIAEEVERVGVKGYPAFKRALKAADGRLIIISQLGQLVKSPKFLRLLQQSSNFVVLGQPDCRPDTVNVLTMAAEDLAATTRARIKDTMENLKRRGVPLGSNRPGAVAGSIALRKHAGKGPKVASQMRRERAQDYYQFVMPRIIDMRQQGMSHNTIAQVLNEEGLTLQNGGPYHEVAVLRLKKRWESEHGKIAAQFDKPGRR